MNEPIRSVVTTLVDGEPLGLENFDRELVHIPGYIQPQRSSGAAAKYNDKPEKWTEITYVAGDRQHGGEAEGDEVVICVRGNGIGIKPRHHPQIFKIFRRLRMVGTNSEAGPGGRRSYATGSGSGSSRSRASEPPSISRLRRLDGWRTECERTPS